jgi:tRNA nucleotidyltransferase/poly(A) polymerase
MARASDPIAARQAATWIVKSLRDAGHTAYFAGGCVRDGLLGLHPTDFDVATDAPPQRVRAVFPHTAEVGAAFGVVLVHLRAGEYGGGAPGERRGDGRVSVEVATFRSDGPYSDARRPDTVRFSDAQSDAQRRDFTINALFLDPLAPADDASKSIAGAELHGRVIDFVGGIADLKAAVIRAVGDPDKRLAEDHLRALRAVRFASRLGFQLDPGTASAISRHASDLRGVSRERIGEEMRRMLAHPSRARAAEMLADLGLDAVVLSQQGIKTPLTVLRGLPRDADSVLAMAAWAIDRESAREGRARADWLAAPSQGQSRGWREAMCLSNDETEELEAILATTWVIAQRWETMRIAEKKRIASRHVFGKCLGIVRAWDKAVADRLDADVGRMESDGIGVNPPLLVTGDDLVAAGMKPGPRFKRILDEVRDTQLEGRIRTRAQGMELAGRLWNSQQA